MLRPSSLRRAARAPASSLAPTSKDRGDALEARVQRLLVASGAWRVRRNLVLVDRAGNRSQVDLAYGLLRPVLVECKNYGASGRPVPLEDAAKFKEVLRLHGFAPSRGLLVTTSTFSPRALTACGRPPPPRRSPRSPSLALRIGPSGGRRASQSCSRG